MGVLTTSFCISYLPKQSWSVWIRRRRTRWRMALVLQARLSSSQKKQKGENNVSITYRRGRERRTEIDRQRHRGRQAEAEVCLNCRQTLSVPQGRRNKGFDRQRQRRFIRVIRDTIKYIVQFVLSMGTSMESSVSFLDSIGSAIFLVAQRSVIMHKTTSTDLSLPWIKCKRPHTARHQFIFPLRAR